jgi:tetratricopeptide (TPR) repeat protein
MRLPALRLGFLHTLAPAGALTPALEALLLGRVLLLPGDLPEAEREEICELCALFLNRPLHLSARAFDLPEGRLCVLTEPVDEEPVPVKDSVILASRAIEAGRRRLGLSNELRRLRDIVLVGLAGGSAPARLGQVAAWAQEATDSPSTALRFASAAYRELLALPRATDAELVVEGLAETIAWLLHGVDPRVAEWVLARAVPSTNPGRLVSTEAALLGEDAALQRALAAGLVEHLPERRDDPEELLDLRRPIALLGQLGDLSIPLTLPEVARALRPRVDPVAFRVFERVLRGKPKPLRLGPPSVPLMFPGREEPLARLQALFEPTREIRTAVLYGLAGIGKTAVGAALCDRLGDRLEPVWLTFAGGPEAAWQRVADGLGMDTQRGGEQRTGKGTPGWLRRVHQAIAERDALIVVDDVEAVPESELGDWLPSGVGSCAVLVLSTQAQRVLQREHDAIAVSLGPLGEAEARVLLANRAPGLAEAIRKGEADALLKQLGGHPAAIRIAAGLLEKQSIGEVVALVKKGEQAIHGLAQPALAALDPEERGVVQALALGARTGSPHALVAKMVGKGEVGGVLQRLADRALVDLGPRLVRLHGIVQLAVVAVMSGDRRRALEVAHAEAADALMEGAREKGDEVGQEELYGDAMLALGRMTERCKAEEKGLARIVANLAFEIEYEPRAPSAEPLVAAIDGLRVVLDIWTRENNANEWASAQNKLGAALARLRVGDRVENLRRAIGAFRLALTVYSKESNPKDWAMVQGNLAGALAELPVGNRREDLRQSIEACELALSVLSEQDDPVEWAAAQNFLGVAYLQLPDEDRLENHRKAIAAFEAAIRVYASGASRFSWAMVQMNLGCVLINFRGGDRGDNIRVAIECFLRALTVYTAQVYPEHRALALCNLGTALVGLPDGDQVDNNRRAIESYELALALSAKDASPLDWARIQLCLGIALARVLGDKRRESLSKSIESFRAALTVYTEEAFPDLHTITQSNLDNALRELAALAPATDPPPPP